jgi:hypothetical protein
LCFFLNKVVNTHKEKPNFSLKYLNILQKQARAM